MLKTKFKKFKNRLKTKLKEVKANFQKNLKKAKAKNENSPVSKRRSFGLGFALILTLGGLFKVAPVLPVLADQLPNPNKGKDLAPVDPNKYVPMTSTDLINILTGSAAAICSGAIQSASFLVGALCGLIVLIGILKALGK